jgi:VWFA-related protein
VLSSITLRRNGSYQFELLVLSIFMRLRHLIFVILVGFLGLASPTTSGQTNQDAPIKVQTTLVNVPVIVSDRLGRYVSGLTLNDFKLYEDRIEQRIAICESTEEPINVALLLDTSHSTTPVLDDIKKEATSFLKELRPQDRALVMSFDYDLHLLSPLTSDRKKMERAIKDATIGERLGTVLRDAVADIIEHQFERVDGRKAIILLTDGKDFGSRVSEEALLDEATESGAMIYSVFFETGPQHRNRQDRRDRPRTGWGRRGRFPLAGQMGGQRRQRVEMRNAEAREFLTDLSDVSAGRFYSSDVSDLQKTFKLVAEELRHQYRLGFYPDGAKADGLRHTLRVEVDTPGAVVRARRSYQATSLTH